MKKETTVFVYATMYSLLAIPYFLYASISINAIQLWPDYFPIFLYFTFNYTGTFLFNAIPNRYSANQLLKYCTAGISISLIISVLMPFSAVFVEISAACVGIFASILVAVYTEVQYHESYYRNNNLSTKDFIKVALWMFGICTIAIVLVSYNLYIVGLGLYGVIFGLAYVLLKDNPEYPILLAKDGGQNKIVSGLLVLIFIGGSAIIYEVKRLRQFHQLSTAKWLIVLLVVTIIGVIYVHRKSIFKQVLDRHHYYFAVLYGVCVNFSLLYGSLYFLEKQGIKEMYTHVYLAYILGVIFSVMIGDVVVNLFPGNKKLLVTFSCLLFCIVGISFSIGVTLSIFFVGFFGTLCGKYLNQEVYQKESVALDKSILIRNRWSKGGSIMHMLFLIDTMIILCFFKGISVETLFLGLNGQFSLSELTQEKVGIIVLYSGKIIGCVISFLIIYYMVLYQKTLDSKLDN